MSAQAAIAHGAGKASAHVAKARLDSWKSIAEYLKRSPRTVQRWHAEFGLPVHHFGGGKGPVFSYSDELDAWLSGFVEEAGEDNSAADAILAARRRQSLQLTAQAGQMWEVRSEENLAATASLYRKAIDQDPSNGAAFVGMANSMILAALMGAMRSSAAYPRAVESLQRALRLGADSLEARCAAAWLQLVHERKWRLARDGFEEVLNKQPQFPHALTGRALLYVVEGDFANAEQCMHTAWERNTFASASNVLLCWAHYLAGDAERALETVAQSRAGGDSGALSAAVEAFALIQSGPISRNFTRLESIAAGFTQSPVLQGALGYAYAITDQANRAREILHSLKRLSGEPAYALALILMGLDERYQAVSCMEASYAEGSLWSLGFSSDPIFQALRGDPRFESLLRKLAPAG
jgi:tetratricopeptide (TPR) repeat protein